MHTTEPPSRVYKVTLIWPGEGLGVHAERRRSVYMRVAGHQLDYTQLLDSVRILTTATYRGRAMSQFARTNRSGGEAPGKMMERNPPTTH
jgi:hypothetical protein